MKKKIVINNQDALVIIDGQNDFIEEDGALYVAGVDGELPNEEIIARIKEIFQLPFGYKTASKDKHLDRHIEHEIYGRHCARYTKGQLSHKKLRHLYQNADDVLEKGMHPAIISYSVATSPDFPDHIEIIRQKKIKRIFIVGWAFTHCVGESAIDYARQGFDVYVIRDLCRSVPPPHGDPETMIKKLELYGVKLIYSKDIP